MKKQITIRRKLRIQIRRKPRIIIKRICRICGQELPPLYPRPRIKA